MSRWRATTSPTAARSWPRYSSSLLKSPVARRSLSAMRSSGRGRLPAWLVKIRSAYLLLESSADSDNLPRAEYERAVKPGQYSMPGVTDGDAEGADGPVPVSLVRFHAGAGWLLTIHGSGVFILLP